MLTSLFLHEPAHLSKLRQLLCGVQFALKSMRVSVEAAAVKKKSAHTLSRPRLSLVLSLAVVGQVSSERENHLSSNCFSVPSSQSSSMASEKSAAKGESFRNT